MSLAIMPFLSWFERRTGRELGSASAVADSRQTLLCTYLSAVLLVGLVLNSTLGWTWADPIAALVIAAVAIKEGVEAWRGDACCSPVAGLRADGAAPHHAPDARHERGRLRRRARTPARAARRPRAVGAPAAPTDARLSRLRWRPRTTRPTVEEDPPGPDGVLRVPTTERGVWWQH